MKSRLKKKKLRRMATKRRLNEENRDIDTQVLPPSQSLVGKVMAKISSGKDKV